jgi:hypothetical protein
LDITIESKSSNRFKAMRPNTNANIVKAMDDENIGHNMARVKIPWPQNHA